MIAQGIEPVLFLRNFLLPGDLLEQVLDFVFKLVGPFRIKGLAVGMFFKKALHLIQLIIQSGPGQGWSQVINNDCRGSALGLGSLSGIIDNEGVEMRNWTQNRLGEILSPQGNTSSRKPFQVSVFAKMNDRMCFEGLPDPRIKREICRWRRQFRIMVNRLGLNAESSLGLDADENVSQSDSRNRNFLLGRKRILIWPLLLKLLSGCFRKG